MATQRSLSRFSTLKKSRKFRDRARRESRRMHLEHLEDRRVMATGPTLSALFLNGNEIPTGGTFKDVPRELRLRFNDGTGMDAASLATGIRLVRSGSDDVFGQTNDVIIQPGVVQLAPNPREVLIRFVDNLPDDLYRVELVGAGLTPLKNQAGEPFNGGVNQNFDFQLDLGPAVISVVPQPITRNPVTGALSQARNQIEVYFNTDALNVTAAQNPTFYRLTDTQSGASGCRPRPSTRPRPTRWC